MSDLSDEQKLVEAENELADLEETWAEFMKDQPKYALALNALGEDISAVRREIRDLKEKLGQA